jgi:hypothetical protein
MWVAEMAVDKFAAEDPHPIVLKVTIYWLFIMCKKSKKNKITKSKKERKE